MGGCGYRDDLSSQCSKCRAADVTPLIGIIKDENNIWAYYYISFKFLSINKNAISDPGTLYLAKVIYKSQYTIPQFNQI